MLNRTTSQYAESEVSFYRCLHSKYACRSSSVYLTKSKRSARKKTWSKMLKNFATTAAALRHVCRRRSSVLRDTAPFNACSHRHLLSTSSSSASSDVKPEVVLPPHTKFRMPDLDFEVRKHCCGLLGLECIYSALAFVVCVRGPSRKFPVEVEA